jgi:hypothetical protein
MPEYSACWSLLVEWEEVDQQTTMLEQRILSVFFGSPFSLILSWSTWRFLDRDSESLEILGSATHEIVGGGDVVGVVVVGLNMVSSSVILFFSFSEGVRRWYRPIC